MSWDFNSTTPIYVQIIEHIKLSIAVGEYKAGEKLLSVRELAAEAEVNPNTMQKALSELERDGLLFTQRTAGRFVTEDSEAISKLREQLAEEHLDMFLKKMKSLGYTQEEALEMLRKHIG
ncbi:MAG: GntR family transcriptional regulator [Oscillospiraceae bacterium]|nr:GntR family transcriptional regulator [Oscillospiraceae bacterium]